MAKSSPLHRVTDGAQWDAEDVFGGLGIVANAAFLDAGFLPCGGAADTSTPSSVSRRYTLPQLGHKEGADTAVLCLSRRGRRPSGGCGRTIVVDAYVDRNGRQRSGDREKLTLDAVAAVLSRGLDDAARALRSTGEAGGGAWLWKLLADRLCRGLFLYLCGRNGVELAVPRLPDDVVVAILCRLDAVTDLVRVECAGKELRRLVAEYDAVLWKPVYEAMRRRHAHTAGERDASGPPFLSEEMALVTNWKGRYAVATWQRVMRHAWQTWRSVPMPSWTPRVPPGEMSARLETIVDMVQQRSRDWHSSNDQYQHHGRAHERPAEQRVATRHTEATWGRGWRGDDSGNRRAIAMAAVVQSDWYRKGKGAGAVHSPSSRYQWKHR